MTDDDWEGIFETEIEPEGIKQTSFKEKIVEVLEIQGCLKKEDSQTNYIS